MVDYSKLYKPNYYVSQSNHFSSNCCGIKIYRNATVLPFREMSGERLEGGGIITEAGEYLENTARHYGVGCAYPVVSAKKKDEKVIFLGMFHDIWGHWLTDNIRRLWFLHTEEYIEQYSHYKLIYTTLPGFRPSGNVISFLRILGIDIATCEEIKEPLQYDEVIVPDDSFFCSSEDGLRYFTREYQSLIERVRAYAADHKETLNHHKYYFTYATVGKKKQIGEEKLEKFFFDRGYTVIAPESLSFEEQLNILANTEEFASTIGSCSHNMLFLPDGAKVTLIPRANYLTGYQRAIDDINQTLEISYIDSSLSFLVDDRTPWNGPFFYLITPNLCSAFHVPYEQYSQRKNDKGIIRYIIRGIRKREPRKCKKAVSYYSDELTEYYSRRISESFVLQALKHIFNGLKRIKRIISSANNI